MNRLSLHAVVHALLVLGALTGCEQDASHATRVSVAQHIQPLPRAHKDGKSLERLYDDALIELARSYDLEPEQAWALAGKALLPGSKQGLEGSLADVFQAQWPKLPRCTKKPGWVREDVDASGAPRGEERATCETFDVPSSFPDSTRARVKMTDGVVIHASILATFDPPKAPDTPDEGQTGEQAKQDAHTAQAALDAARFAKILKTYYEAQPTCTPGQARGDGFDLLCKDIMVTLRISDLHEGTWIVHLSYSSMHKDVLAHQRIRQWALQHHPEYTTPGKDTEQANQDTLKTLEGL